MVSVSRLVSTRRGASHNCVAENQHRLYPMVGGVMLVKGMRRPSCQSHGQHGKITTHDMGATSDLTNVKAVFHVTAILTCFFADSNVYSPVQGVLFVGVRKMWEGGRKVGFFYSTGGSLELGSQETSVRIGS